MWLILNTQAEMYKHNIFLNVIIKNYYFVCEIRKLNRMISIKLNSLFASIIYNLFIII